MSFPSITQSFLLPPNTTPEVHIGEGKVDPLHTIKKYKGLEI
jgi:hypothetical protein